MENFVSATDTFVSFLLSLKDYQPITLLSIFFLTLGRILPIITIAPFLGAKNLPMTVRMMFAIALCVLFVPQNILRTHGDIPYGMTFIGFLCKELLIGYFLAFLAAAPFYIASATGSLIDHSRGSSSLQVTDPMTQTQTSPIGSLYNYILIAIFYSLNGPFLFFDALAHSYQLVPIDGLLSAAFFNINVPFWKQMIGLGQKILNLTIQLSAPALIGMLFTDLFLGIANRLAPQVQVVFLGIPLKSWVGIALMTAAWVLILHVLGKESISWIKALNQTINQAGRFATS